MVVKRVSSVYYMQLWRHLVDNREIIVTGSTYLRFIPPRSPLSQIHEMCCHWCGGHGFQPQMGQTLNASMLYFRWRL